MQHDLGQSKIVKHPAIEAIAGGEAERREHRRRGAQLPLEAVVDHALGLRHSRQLRDLLWRSRRVLDLQTEEIHDDMKSF